MVRPGSPIIRVSHLDFAFRGQPVLSDVSLQVAHGQLTVLLGPNGSGKSTLLRLMAGVLNGARGSIEVTGKPLAALTGLERARLIGYLPQSHQAVFPFRVEDVVLTGRTALGGWFPSAYDRARVKVALETVGISHLCQRPYTALSGGERQLVLIARVLAQQPRIVLLDEPLSHLDLANQARMLGVIQRLVRDGISVLAVLHDPTTAFLHADAFLFLKGGRLLAPPEGCLPWDPGFLHQVYGIEPSVVEVGPRAVVVPAPGAL